MNCKKGNKIKSFEILKYLLTLYSKIASGIDFNTKTQKKIIRVSFEKKARKKVAKSNKFISRTEKAV